MLHLHQHPFIHDNLDCRAISWLLIVSRLRRSASLNKEVYQLSGIVWGSKSKVFYVHLVILSFASARVQINWMQPQCRYTMEAYATGRASAFQFWYRSRHSPTWIFLVKVRWNAFDARRGIPCAPYRRSHKKTTLLWFSSFHKGFHKGFTNLIAALHRLACRHVKSLFWKYLAARATYTIYPWIVQKYVGPYPSGSSMHARIGCE